MTRLYDTTQTRYLCYRCSVCLTNWWSPSKLETVIRHSLSDSRSVNLLRYWGRISIVLSVCRLCVYNARVLWNHGYKIQYLITINNVWNRGVIAKSKSPGQISGSVVKKTARNAVLKINGMDQKHWQSILGLMQIGFTVYKWL